MLLETAAHGVKPKRSIVRVRDRGLVRSGRIAAASLGLSCSGTARMRANSSMPAAWARECQSRCWPIYAAAWSDWQRKTSPLSVPSPRSTPPLRGRRSCAAPSATREHAPRPGRRGAGASDSAAAFLSARVQMSLCRSTHHFALRLSVFGSVGACALSCSMASNKLLRSNRQRSSVVCDRRLF